MYSIVDTSEKLQKSLQTLSKDTIIACDTECTSLDYRKGKIEGIGYGTNKNTFFLPFPHTIPTKEVYDIFVQLFQKVVIFHNAKYDLQVLVHNKLPIPNVLDGKLQDTMIMSWLVDENTSHGLKQLARDLLGREPKEWKELNRQPDLFRDESDILKELADYCMDDVVNTFDLYFYLLPLLDKEKLTLAYERVELKIIPVLCAMEMRGVQVDVPFLKERHDAAQKELFRLNTAIQAKLKEVLPKGYPPVNLRSPKQLEDILFKQFKYKVFKETEKGTASTDAETLREIIRKEKLTDEDFLPMLLKYRELDKLDGTYFVALAEQAGLESVIHCNFLQHGTRTGRFASSEPNLQNIPSRSDDWNVRKAFVPRPGYKFIMADYSQLELRIMAHFSGDETMVHTFKTGGDIHAETMKAIGSNRHHAKTINFGLIYGLGPRSLAQDLHIKEEEAKKYMNRFFNKYHQVKYFMDKTQAITLKTGYVEMITGRRRHFAEIADKRWWNMIARQAVNTKIQGSASDLVKVAMIKLHPLLKAIGAHMLIQIHDEVIVETPIEKAEETKAIIKETMENALTFNVPMLVSMKEGERWTKE